MFEFSAIKLCSSLGYIYLILLIIKFGKLAIWLLISLYNCVTVFFPVSTLSKVRFWCLECNYFTCVHEETHTTRQTRQE